MVGLIDLNNGERIDHASAAHHCHHGAEPERLADVGPFPV